MSSKHLIKKYSVLRILLNLKTKILRIKLFFLNHGPKKGNIVIWLLILLKQIRILFSLPSNQRITDFFLLVNKVCYPIESC